MMTGRNGGIEGDEPVAEEWNDEGEVGTLDLDDDERLPWLESGDDDEEQGVDPARILGFVILALLLLAIVLGGGWYLLKGRGDPSLVADGSTIEAPEGPYKQRPENPGGRIAEGTGDMAPAVGQGQSREARLAQPDTPAPSGAAVEPKDAEESSTDDGIAVQVGAFSTRETAERGWATLMRQTEALSGVRHRIVQGRADIGTVYRLQAVAGDVPAAKQLCDALQADGVACQVKR